MNRPNGIQIRKRRRGRQIAALPLRWRADGTPEVLLVTSRETGRWIIPKGWTMSGKTPWKAAKIEASEEAGANGKIVPQAVGSYEYVKLLKDGTGLICDVAVYPMHVEDLARSWKEQGERKRRWFDAESAASMVQEPELAALLLRLRQQRKKDLLKGKVAAGA